VGGYLEISRQLRLESRLFAFEERSHAEQLAFNVPVNHANHANHVKHVNHVKQHHMVRRAWHGAL
jgi:hypothetical protein